MSRVLTKKSRVILLGQQLDSPLHSKSILDDQSPPHEQASSIPQSPTDNENVQNSSKLQRHKQLVQLNRRQ